MFDKARLPTPKRVVHVVRQLNYGGVENLSSIIAQYRHYSKFEHHFIAISHGGHAEVAMRRCGASVVVLNCSSRIPSLVTIFRLVQAIRDKNPDIVHTRGSEANFHGILAARLAGVPIAVAEEVGFPSHSRKARLVFRSIYRLATKVVAISQAVGRYIDEIGECPKHKVNIIYNPVRPPNREISWRYRPVPTIGFVGRLETVKNPIGLLLAVALLKDKGLNCKAILVGDGKSRDHLEAEILKLKLQNNVTLAGHSEDPFSQLLDCNLYVQPSLSEGFGIAIVEAMLCGLPVIASNVGGVSEIISDGETGWLLPNVEPDAIAEKILAIWSLGDIKIQSVAYAGRRSVAERFPPENYIKNCDAFYDGIS